MKFILLLLVCLMVTLEGIVSLNVCERSPRWRLSGKTFPKDFAAKVKLVAFLKASCKFCRTQSIRLGELAKELNESNYSASFLIVNHFEKESVGRGDVFAQSQLPVLQDIQKLNVWNLYKVDTDDMLIFDECDRLVKHMKLPETVVHSGIVKNELIKAHDNKLCGDSCSPKKKPYQA